MPGTKIRTAMKTQSLSSKKPWYFSIPFCSEAEIKMKLMNILQKKSFW